MKLVQLQEAKYDKSYKTKETKVDDWRTRHVVAKIQEIVKYVGDDNLAWFANPGYKDPEMSFSVSNAVEDDYEDFTTQLSNLGWKENEDFRWYIAMGDDWPNGLAITNPSMLFDQDAMEIIFDITDYNVYNQMDQEGWEDEDEDEDW